jgi:type IV secretory pathway VirB10-like protein
MRPDDRELEQYLKGDSAISKRYRAASGETAPPELDEAILALARAEAKRKPPSLNRVMAPLALAASLVIAVNLAWNVREAEPVPVVPLEQPAAAPVPATSPPPPALARAEPERRAPAAPEADLPADLAEAKRKQELQRAAAQEQERQEVAEAAEEMRARQAERSVMAMESAGASASAAPAPQAAMADAATPVLSEAQKIDRLIAHVASLEGAVFIRNGKEYGPAEAAKHLQYKREKAGDRVKTADDFIRLCASHSYLSGEAYLIRFKDGRTRTAEDVLREELARLL